MGSERATNKSTIEEGESTVKVTVSLPAGRRFGMRERVRRSFAGKARGYNIVKAMNSALLITAIVLAAAPVAQGQTAKRAAAASATSSEQIPPVSYVCPMVQDADVVEDKPGKCQKCGMQLVPARLDPVWTCPVHGVVVKGAPGKCPLDGRDLIQMTMSLTWTCRNTDISAIAPGSCADGSPMLKKYVARAHGDHNPKHGGQFFMAPDNRHHLEGAFPHAGVFRLYLYDDYTKPLPRDQMRTATAKVVIQPVDRKAPITTPTQSFTLVPARNGRYLEAKIGERALPAALQAKVKFQADAPEHVFDFSFERYSKEPASSPAAMTMAPAASSPSSAAPATVPRGNSATSAPPPSPASATGAEPIPTGVDPALIPLPIPDTIPELLAQLRTRTNQIKRFIDAGEFAAIYVPAFQAKDLSVALEAHQTEIPADDRKAVESSIAQVVRSAYLLDMLADIGNKQQTSEAYERFAAAVRDIESAFPK